MGKRQDGRAVLSRQEGSREDGELSVPTTDTLALPTSTDVKTPGPGERFEAFLRDHHGVLLAA